MTLTGVDISNHQSHPDAYRLQSWYRDAQFVIVQAIAPPRGFPGWEVGGYTSEQLRTAKDDGKYVGAYVWLWNHFTNTLETQADIWRRLALIPNDVKLDMRLWLDVEDTNPNAGLSRPQDVLDALTVMDVWAREHGLPPTGVYSGGWYINGYLNGWFPEDRMYWMADYTIPPTVLPMRPVHQYTSTPIDMNVMLESEIITTPVVTEPTAAEFRQALSYLKGPVMDGIRSYKYPRVKAAVAEVERVAAQYGA